MIASTEPAETVESPGPTALTDRALAPDLARGLMLLFIALANSHYFLNSDSVRGGFPQGVSAFNSAVAWAIATFVDGRSLPLFGLLFGYGVAQIVRRNEALERRAVRWMLRRRAFALIGVGFFHGLFLYVGDILVAYGVLLFLGAWTVGWRDRWILALAALLFILVSLPADDSLAISAEPPHLSMLPPDPWAMITSRLTVQPVIALIAPIRLACPFLVGLWAGRRQVLERPESYRPLLSAVTVLGISAAVLGAQPVSLMLAGVIQVPDPSTLSFWGPLHDSTGILGGIGYASGITLVASRLGNTCRRVTFALAATGQRSLTCYLSQSVVWSIVFTPFLLNLSGTLTIATTALLAIATWILTVLMATAMQRTGYRGPFEVLVRRVTYSGAVNHTMRSSGTMANVEQDIASQRIESMKMS